MSENLPASVRLETNESGSVTFAQDVVATIAGLATTEVEGVASMAGSSGGLADILNRRGQASRLTKGVKVEVVGDSVRVDVSIVVDFGNPIPEVARNIQENVKKAVETMSGLRVECVDVHVTALSFEREMRAAAEIEEQQRQLLQRKDDKADEVKAEGEKTDGEGAAEEKGEPAESAEETREEPEAAAEEAKDADAQG